MEIFILLWNPLQSVERKSSRPVPTPAVWFTTLSQPVLDLPDAARIIKATRTFEPMGPAMVIVFCRNPSRANRINESRENDGSPFFRISCIRIGRRRVEVIRGTCRRPPFWITNLQRAGGHQESRLHRRCLRHAIPSFPSSLLILLLVLFFSLLLSQSRTLAHAGWPTWRRIRSVFTSGFRPKRAAPNFNLILGES